MPTTLKKEEYEQLDNVITEVIRPAAVGTTVLKPYTIKEHVMELSWDEYKGRGVASLDMFMENENFDNLAFKDRKNVSAPLAHAEFNLPWRMLAAARAAGRDMETADLAEAASVVVTLAEETIFKGSDAFGIKGITNVVGLQTVAGAGFDVAGNAYETFRKVRDALKEVPIFPPYVGFLNPAQDGELDILFASTGISQREKIEGKFVEAVYGTDNITAGEGFVIGNSRQYIDRATLGGVKKELWKKHPDKDTSDMQGQVYAIEIPRIRVPKAIVKMTGI